MYINLILGAVALGVVWFYVKKLFAGNDKLSESPAELLEAEMKRRRGKERETEAVFERLKDAGKQRLDMVGSALEELREALPGEARNRLSWFREEGSLVIAMRGVDGASSSVEVSWNVPELDMGRAARGAGMSGEYVLRFADPLREESAATLDLCMRRITSFIVDILD